MLGSQFVADGREEGVGHVLLEDVDGERITREGVGGDEVSLRVGLVEALGHEHSR